MMGPWPVVITFILFVIIFFLWALLNMPAPPKD